MMRKFLSVLCFAFVMYSVTGCSQKSGIRRSFEQKLNKSIERDSGINSDKTYREYRTMLSDGHIKNEFYYDEKQPVMPASDPERADVTPQAHISFAKNYFLNVRYFTDENMENEITDPENEFIYLDPGQSIYAVSEPAAHITANPYRFTEFKVYEYTPGGKKLISSGYDDNTGLVYTVPEDCPGLELSVEPAGEYSRKTVTLSDYYSDDTFGHHNTDGVWNISGREFKSGSAEISSPGSYIVSYEFNPEKYFFVSSEPNYFWQNNSRVIFSQSSFTDDTDSYSVELHPFISTVLVSEANTKVDVNGVLYGNYTKDQNIEITKLKFGDTVTVTSSKKDNIKYDKNVLELKKSDDTFGVYTFIVRELSEDFAFDPADYRYDHGQIEFRYLGKKITGRISLSAGRQIEYSAVSSDDGYWLPDGNNVITISEDPAETRKAFESIRFYEKKLVTVNFPQPECGGTVTYKKQERTIMSGSEKMFSGTPVKLIYKPWNGWCSTVDEDIYIVSDKDNVQTVSVNGTDINDIFTEDDNHKPKLRITVDRLVGSEMRFAVNSSDVSVSDLRWTRKDNCIFDGDTGTADGITVSVGNAQIASDQMLKLTIEKTDNKNIRYTDIRYITSSPSSELIDIYAPDTRRSSEMYYTDISISITLEDKLTWLPESADNAKIQMKFADTEDQAVLKKNDIIDRDRMVTLTVQPDEGYYLIGPGVSAGMYQTKIKYSDYLSDMEKILRTHPVMKIYSVDLKTDDKFGKVVYTLNGEEVSGHTDLKETDELILTYTLENKDYVIYKDFLSAMAGLLSKSPYERSETIRITPDIDGKTIKREDYITIQKKEQ